MTAVFCTEVLNFVLSEAGVNCVELLVPPLQHMSPEHTKHREQPTQGLREKPTDPVSSEVGKKLSYVGL